MVVSSAQKAVDNANAQSSCDPGYCLKYTRTWLGIGSKEADAADAWANAIGKHKGDKHPPKGAPVFWTGGTNGHGHIALAKNDNMRSTDIPSSGKVGNDNGAWPKAHWGLTYVGWAEGFNGTKIPWLNDEPDWRSGGKVYVDCLFHGKQESQSVSRLRWKLEHDDRIPANKKPGLGSDSKDGANYGDSVAAAVAYYQKNVTTAGGPKDGSSMSNAQANALFGDNYTVVEE